jgi:hypothetical protein
MRVKVNKFARSIMHIRVNFVVEQLSRENLLYEISQHETI